MFVRWLLGGVCVLASLQATEPSVVGGSGPLYSVGFSNGHVYAINIENGSFASVTDVGLDAYAIVLQNRNTAFVSQQSTRKLYQVNLQNGDFSTKATFPPGFASAGLALLDGTTGFITGGNEQIYTFNQQTGAISLFTTIPGAALADIQILDNTTAYASNGFNSIYSVNLKTGSSQVVATFSGDVNPSSLQLINTHAAYVVGGNDANVYLVDLITGAITQVNTTAVGTVAPNGSLWGSAVNGNSLYTANLTDETDYVVNLLTGAHTVLATIGGSGLIWDTLYLQMQTQGLSGNNLKLAEYLNANAPLWVIRPFSLQANGLPFALQSASPARNAFSTFASQNGYLASSQLLIDHSHGQRFFYQMTRQNPEKILTADASGKVQSQPKNPKNRVWITPFGEYAREKAQMQTPEFTMSVGGGLLGYDYTSDKGDVLGIGGSYVYTHVSDAGELGSANVNQGFATLYTTLLKGQWYVDMSIWGGYYSSANVRNIQFPLVNERAKATITGWQTAGHFEVGYDWIASSFPNKDWFSVEPFMSGDWVGNWEKAFQEHGAGDLNMGQKGRFACLLRTEGGLRLHEMVCRESGSKLIFSEKGSYAYQKAFKTGQITAFLVGSPGTFSVSTLTGAQNLAVLEFSVLYINPNGFHFDARGQGEIGSMYYSGQGVFEIGYDF